MVVFQLPHTVLGDQALQGFAMLRTHAIMSKITNMYSHAHAVQSRAGLVMCILKRTKQS